MDEDRSVFLEPLVNSLEADLHQAFQRFCWSGQVVTEVDALGCRSVSDLEGHLVADELAIFAAYGIAFNDVERPMSLYFCEGSFVDVKLRVVRMFPDKDRTGGTCYVQAVEP